MWHWLLLPFLVILQPSKQNEGRIVCYYRSDNVYRSEGYRMQPQEIDADLCTHVIYYAAYLHPREAIVPSDPNIDFIKGGYKKIVKLKEHNPRLKILISVKSDPEEKDLWPLIASQKSTRHWFANLAVNFLRSNHFDGIDIDWQIHNSRKNCNNYLRLIEDLRTHMEYEAQQLRLPRLELSVMLPAQIQQLHRHFLLANVSMSVDFMNVATMDYWSLSPHTVQHHAPLYKNISEGSLAPLNVHESIKYYLFKCVAPEKIVLGIPTYGRSFKLDNGKRFQMGSECKYPGERGFATNSPGTLAYFEICTYMIEENWSIGNPNATSMGPYAYHDDRWVGFDDVAIISKKAKFARDKGLGGLMFWTIDQDDFRGYCRHRYGLIRAGKFTFSTGILVDNAEMLKEAEDSMVDVQSWGGYEYPIPTIRQPDNIHHEVSTIPIYHVSTTTPSTTYSQHDTSKSIYNKIPTTTVNYSTTITIAPTTSTTIATTKFNERPTITTTMPTTKSTTSAATTKSTPSAATTRKPTTTTTPTQSTSKQTTTTERPSTKKSTTMTPVTTRSTTTTTRTPVQETTETSSRVFITPSTPNPQYDNKITPSDLFRPLQSSDETNASDSSLNNAISQLNRVLNTINEVIHNINDLNSASRLRNPAQSNTTVDPSLFNILQPLLNLQNSANSIANNPSEEKLTNTTVQVNSDVKKYAANDNIALPSEMLSTPLLANFINITRRDPNSSIPLNVLTDKALYISGRDIVTINLNISVNNNYYGKN